MMKLSSIIAKAKQDPAFASSLMAMTKIAASKKDDESEFNEGVPATDQKDQKEDLSGQQAGKVAQPVDNSQVVEDQTIPVGADQQGQVVQEGPEAAGARAAQAFIGPEVFQAALQGDGNAMQLISMVAGQVSAAATSAAAAPQAAPQAGMDPTSAEAGVNPEEYAAMQQTGMMQPAPTPEEQVANMIVAPQQQPAAQPVAPPAQQKQVTVSPGSQEQPKQPGEEKKENPFAGKKEEGGAEKEKVEGVDDETLSKIVKLVKAGKL